MKLLKSQVTRLEQRLVSRDSNRRHTYEMSRLNETGIGVLGRIGGMRRSHRGDGRCTSSLWGGVAAHHLQSIERRKRQSSESRQGLPFSVAPSSTTRVDGTEGCRPGDKQARVAVQETSRRGLPSRRQASHPRVSVSKVPDTLLRSKLCSDTLLVPDTCLRCFMQ